MVSSNDKPSDLLLDGSTSRATRADDGNAGACTKVVDGDGTIRYYVMEAPVGRM